MNVVSDKGEVMELKFDQFYDVEKKISTAKFAEDKPLLKDVQVVQFQRNSTKMFWKQSYDDVEFKSALFLKKKAEKAVGLPFPPVANARGINTVKKQNILDTLKIHLDENRRAFWENMPTNDTSSRGGSS